MNIICIWSYEKKKQNDLKIWRLISCSLILTCNLLNVDRFLYLCSFSFPSSLWGPASSQLWVLSNLNNSLSFCRSFFPFFLLFFSLFLWVVVFAFCLLKGLIVFYLKHFFGNPFLLRATTPLRGSVIVLLSCFVIFGWKYISSNLAIMNISRSFRVLR